MIIFAFVPLVVRLCIIMQLKIGNGELFPVKLFQAHEQAIVYGCWAMIVIGFGIILFLDKNDILKDLK